DSGKRQGKRLPYKVLMWLALTSQRWSASISIRWVILLGSEGHPGDKTRVEEKTTNKAIVSHLEFMDVEIEQDDLNQKFLTSLAPEWLMYTIIKYEDINQIDKDDIEEMDIKWNMTLLSMRADRFWKKTGKKITIQGTDVAGFDKSKEIREKLLRPQLVRFGDLNRTLLIKDSGCSRHMTGNISYLSEYEPFDGGYVSFGQGSAKITGKGTIKTGKLEFENVYFVKDLKYNLFSVSQICDNKNSVLFTNSECIVLGRDFKLKDDTNVLLRTPRQHNMYFIDLNNTVPHKDLTCLIAKASIDESMLWHRRLGHLNFKTMNKLVRHNLLKGRFNFRRTSLTGFLAQSIRSSNAIALDSPYLLVLITGTSQSRQHDKSESDSYYLSDLSRQFKYWPK
nr:ribonuclease H-like domain-containing protein [Tanacetum cinerariifolium]